MAVNIYSSGNIISSGIMISGAIIAGKNNFIEVTSGGIASDTTVYSRGNIYVENGGYAVGTVVNSMGTLTLDNAVADSSVINSRGTLQTGSNATINHTILDGGKAYIYEASCTANQTIIRNSGTLSIEKGFAWNTMVNNNGILLLSNGATAENTTFASNGIGAVLENGIISNTIISGGVLTVSGGGSAVDTTVYSGGHVYLEDNAQIKNLDIQHGGTLHILESTENGTLNGTLTVGGKVIAKNDVTGYYTVVWSLAHILPAESPMIEGLDHFAATEFSITVKSNQTSGTYFLANGFSAPAGFTVSIGNETTSCGTLSLQVNQTMFNNKTYVLTWQDNDALYLTVADQQTQNTNLLQNGFSQIAAWDAEMGIVGYLSVDGKNNPEWSKIAQWSEQDAKIWTAAGAGHFQGSTGTQDGILLCNKAQSLLAVWTDLKNPDSGYMELYQADGNVSICGLANLNGDVYDDILLCDDNGSFGVLYGGVEWHSICNTQNTLQVIGAGNFGAPDGLDSLLIKNTVDHSYSLWHNNNDPSGQNWSQTALSTLDDDWTVAAIGDFLGDGVDDIILWQKSTGDLYAWDNGNSTVKRAIGAVNQEHWEIAAVGDYNGDGQDDLLLRELVTGRGRLAYLASGDTVNWTDLHSNIATDTANQFHIIA